MRYRVSALRKAYDIYKVYWNTPESEDKNDLTQQVIDIVDSEVGTEWLTVCDLLGVVCKRDMSFNQFRAMMMFCGYREIDE